jgi:hypothetical protein
LSRLDGPFKDVQQVSPAIELRDLTTCK